MEVCLVLVVHFIVTAVTLHIEDDLPVLLGSEEVLDLIYLVLDTKFSRYI